MIRRLLSATGLTLVLLGAASAAVTEVSKSFPNQTTAMTATAIMTAPTAAANYLLCTTTTTMDTGGPPAAVLSWTDENGNRQSAAESSAGCTLIRNAANSAPAIAVPAWNGAEPYNVYVWGIGFWPGGAQSQKGITETVNGTFGPLQGSAELSGDSLIVVSSVHGTGSCSWGVGGVAGVGTAWFPMRITGSVNFFNNSSGCEETVIVVNFGTPATGSGPLTDYEYGLLGWTNATYPYPKTVFIAGSSGANVLMAANIAEAPNSGKVSEEIYVVGGNSIACTRTVGPSGVPGSCVSTGFLAATNAILLETQNASGLLDWGASPTYSAEVDVIQF